MIKNGSTMSVQDIVYPKFYKTCILSCTSGGKAKGEMEERRKEGEGERQKVKGEGRKKGDR